MTVATFCHYIPSPGVLSDHLCVLRKTCPTPACSHICSCHSKKGQCIVTLSCIGSRALNVRQMLQQSSHIDLPKPSCQPAVGAFCLLPLPRPAVCSLCCSIPDWILAQPSQHPPALQQGFPALNSSSETAWCTAKKRQSRPLPYELTFSAAFVALSSPISWVKLWIWSSLSFI